MSITDLATARRSALIRAGAALAAGLVALALWAVLTGPLGIEPMARFGDEVVPIGPASVAISAVVAGLGGWAVAVMVERRAARPRLRWMQIAVGVAIVSLLGPYGNAEGTEALVALSALHVVTALVVVPVVAVSVAPKAVTATAVRPAAPSGRS